MGFARRAGVKQRLCALVAASMVGIGGVSLAASPAGASTSTTVVGSGAVAENWPWALANSSGTYSFVTGPGSPPGGTGSLAMSILAAPLQHEAVYNETYGVCTSGPACNDPSSNWTALSSITALSMAAYRASGTTYPSINVEVDYDVTTGPHYTSLVFIPNAGAIVDGTWQNWSGLSTSDGTWYSTANLHIGPFNCAFQAAGCNASWAQIIAAYPNAKIRFGLGPNVGSGGSFSGNVDNFTVGVGPATTIYDFEPNCTMTCYVSASTGSDFASGHQGDPFKTIQAGINAVSPGGTVKVRPGSYNETAPNVSPTSIPGTYQFGLYLGKNNITVEGVHADDTPITNHADPAIPTVTTNSTANFGPDGVFVEGDGDTMSGLSIGANLTGCNKSIEVVGDAFTFANGIVNDPCRGDIYIDDFRYNTGTDTPHVKSYTITGSEFGPGNTIDIGSGPGHGTAASNRLITNNVFDPGGGFGGLNGGGYWPVISFNGAGSGVAWFVYPVGGATISGNTFAGRDQYIRARGTYDTATFDWNSYFTNNTFSLGAAMTTTPTSDVQTYAYSYTLPGYGCPANTCNWNNIRRINGTLQTPHGAGCFFADCNGDVDNAQPGDTVNIQGTFNESVNLTKAVSLLGVGTTATLNGAGTGVAVNSPGPLSISFLHFTGFTPSVDVANTSVAPTVIRNSLIKLVTAAASTVNGTCNWWGQATGPAAGQVVGAATTNPFLATSNLTGPCVSAPPGAPTITQVYAGPSPDPSPTSVEVAFTPPASDGGSPIISYTATCMSFTGGPTGSASGTGSPILVGGLAKGGYQCTVTATNAFGTSPPSAPFTVFVDGTGNCASIPTAPTVLSTGPGNASATVSWAPASGCIAGYIVTPYIGSAALPALAKLVPGTEFQGATTTVLSGLTNGVAYQFTVQAENGAVAGPASAFSATVTAGAPTAATALSVTKIGGGTFKITFKAPNNNGAPIIKYTATCRSHNGGVTRAKTAKTGPLSVTGLTPGATYTCAVKATNKRGTGPTSRASPTAKA